MAQLLPKWLQRRHLLLKHEFDGRKFTFKEAQEALGDDSRIVNLCLSELRKAGWLTSEQNPKETKTKLYKLEDREKVEREIINELKDG
ncbi:MAG: hypothetical protein KGH55_01560 [Nanoarchaeota archaeon]|nr:hypothetical protein [Nanoarchaeota archaeon]